jgi:enamine deaminase RidA (YjgF/YER057c/UK114 family)
MASDQIERHKNPAHMTEPWAREFAEAIEVPATAEYIYLSGVGPMVANKNAPANTVKSYGDTETQTRSVLAQIKETLQNKGYTMADIVSMQAMIVGDPAKNGQADFSGFSKVYNEHFGTTSQPDVPVRTRAQVVRLVPPGWLVEVTVIAAKVKR